MQAAARTLRWIIVVTIAVMLSPVAGGQALSQQQIEQIDAIFADWDTDHTPGCALGIYMNGEIAHVRGYGMANLEHAVPIDSRSVFRIGSTSKQFTTACILLLEIDGKLSRDDTLHRHFPEMPEDWASQITLRHLIHHTSGLPDYLGIMARDGYGRFGYYTPAQALESIVDVEALRFTPGEKFEYSNSNYFLMSQIVERVADQSLRAFAHDRILKPLGMDNTHFHDDHREVVRNRADGYEPQRDGSFAISMTTLEMCGDGGVFTTIEDLHKWDENFHHKRVGGEALFDALHERGVLNDGTQLPYAGGLMIREAGGRRVVEHGGAFVGFRAGLTRFPDERISIALLANRSDARVGQLIERVREVLFSGGDDQSAESAADD